MMNSIDQREDLRISHDDIRKDQEDSSDTDEQREGSVYDIEGVDDIFPNMDKEDLRLYKYGVLKKY